MKHNIQWNTQKITRGEFTVRLDGPIGGNINPVAWTDWQEIFEQRMWKPVPGVGYSGVMSPGSWGWGQMELSSDGAIKAVVAVDRVASFVEHLNGLVARTNEECEARQRERVRANEAVREQQRHDAARDEELRRQLAEATGKAS